MDRFVCFLRNVIVFSIDVIEPMPTASTASGVTRAMSAWQRDDRCTASAGNWLCRRRQDPPGWQGQRRQWVTAPCLAVCLALLACVSPGWAQLPRLLDEFED